MTQADKDVVRRRVGDVVDQGHIEVSDELCSPELAEHVRRWVPPFRASFPDVHMRVVALLAEADQVAGRFTCSGTHTGHWLGHPPTGRRSEDVDEVHFFGLAGGRIVEMWGFEDTADRLRQLGLA